MQHFVRKEGKPWGFEAVAGMDQLKEELKDSFIKPLKFKFLVEKMRKEKVLSSPPENVELEGVTQNKNSSNITPPNLPFSREE